MIQVVVGVEVFSPDVVQHAGHRYLADRTVAEQREVAGNVGTNQACTLIDELQVDKTSRASQAAALAGRHAGTAEATAGFDVILHVGVVGRDAETPQRPLAFTVGFGGSMLWFGSSAGVALANLFPEARSAGKWLLHGWHVPLGYVAGFFALLLILGGHPHAAVKVSRIEPPAAMALAPSQATHP